MASLSISSQNKFDTFSHLLDNVFLEALYHYSHGCKVSDILPVGDWMAEGYVRSNRAHSVVMVGARTVRSIKGTLQPAGTKYALFDKTNEPNGNLFSFEKYLTYAFRNVLIVRMSVI
jgi:hypothetical protein